MHKVYSITFSLSPSRMYDLNYAVNIVMAFYYLLLQCDILMDKL